MAKLDRRSVLRGLGAAPLLLPSLRQAHAAPGPKRLVIFYSHHGTLPWLWMPKSGGRTDFVLGDLLAPLEPYKKDLILLSGVDFKALSLPGGKTGSDGHATGQASSMTANIQINDESKGDPMSRGKGPSFDFWLARKLEAANGGRSPTRFQEQRLRIYDSLPSNQNWGRPYQDDTNKWLLPTARASDVYNRLFGAMMAPSGNASAAALRKKRALALASAELKTVGSTFGKYERTRLEQHADLVNDLAKLVEGGSQSGTASCQAPAPPGMLMPGAGANWKLTSEAIPRLAAAALACDLTRVVVIHVDEVAKHVYGGLNPATLGGVDNLHDLVHLINVEKKEDQDAARLQAAKGFYKAHADLFRVLLDKLAELKEADGKRVLDQTAVLWCGELAQPGHSANNAKWLIAGGCGGALRTGQYMNWDGDRISWGGARDNVPSNGDVFTTLAHAMGVKETFGAAGATRGPIADILA